VVLAARLQQGRHVIESPLALDATARQELIGCYRDGLLNDTMAFWFPRCIDGEHGGYTIACDRDGTQLDDDKGVWQQGRAAWLLGELYNTVERRDEWLEWCRCGIEFLDRFAFDPRDGRMWFHLARDGTPIRKRRYAFSEAFAAIAYGEYAQATDDDAYADKARRCFDRFLTHEPAPKFEPARPMKAIGVPMIAIATAQQLRDSIALDHADGIIDRSIETIVRDHVKHDIECVMETVGPNGELLDHFDGRTLNPGHAIEAAWFILHEGARRDDAQMIDVGCTMLEWMWRRGWDEEFGGVLHFVDVFGKPVQEYWHDMKFWWPHNETIIATLYAALLTGESRYVAMHRDVHDWAYRHFADAEHGEWYGYLRRDGRVSSPAKGNLWKGPFHLPRMQLTCWKLLDEALTVMAPRSDSARSR